MVVLSTSGRATRLGVRAAGTSVGKASAYVWLWQLPGGQPRPAPPAGPPAPGTPAQYAPPPAFAPATPTEVYLRRLDPDLRRFIASYARRRPELPLPLRAQLAGQVQGNLYRAAPDVYTQHGPLAALDYLADLERGAGVPVGSAPQSSHSSI